jgi:glycosyltransferase involved in cell wall biosynthesis
MRHYFHQVLASHELGGAGLVALQLASTIKGRDQESHVWIPGEGPARRKAESLGLMIHTYRARNLFNPSKIKAMTNNGNFWREVSSYSPGLIHLHSPLQYRALQWALRLSHLRCVVHVQLEEDAEGLRWAFEMPPDLIVTCARFLVDHVRQTLPARYQAQARICAVPNPVDTEEFYPGDKLTAKHRVEAPAKIPLLLMLANLAPHKGQETAIKVIAMLKRAGIEAVLWLAGVERGGTRHYTTVLQNLCTTLGVEDRVQLLGYRSDAADLLRAADIFLLPSTHEGLPLSILEAQATRVPVLAAPTAGIPEVIIDGHTGFLSPATDISRYTSCIQLLLRNGHLYRHITEHAYLKVTSEYTWKVYSERIWSLYGEILVLD